MCPAKRHDVAMGRQVMVTTSSVHFERDKREARKLGCPTRYGLPLERVQGATLVDGRRGSVWLVVDTPGAAHPTLEENPHAMLFQRSGKSKAAAVAELINQRAGGSALDASLAASSRHYTDNQQRMFRFAHRASGVALFILAIAALIMVIALGVMLWAVISVVS